MWSPTEIGESFRSVVLSGWRHPEVIHSGVKSPLLRSGPARRMKLTVDEKPPFRKMEPQSALSPGQWIRKPTLCQKWSGTGKRCAVRQDLCAIGGAKEISR